ncbi:hypothetical protein T492DRAFT_833891 [Pavlovales sp. CCMP2436]|nr:hypothetical protein T492DRAFT_833891 [Pavlovales sp. CCMP2436]
MGTSGSAWASEACGTYLRAAFGVAPRELARLVAELQRVGARAHELVLALRLRVGGGEESILLRDLPAQLATHAAGPLPPVGDVAVAVRLAPPLPPLREWALLRNARERRRRQAPVAVVARAPALAAAARGGGARRGWIGGLGARVAPHGAQLRVEALHLFKKKREE